MFGSSHAGDSSLSLRASAQHLRIFGLGNCSDDRKGSSRLLGENLEKINKMIRLSEGATVPDQCMPCEVLGERVFIRPSVFIVTDTSCLRHCEHIAASGWRGCSRDDALRTPRSRRRRRRCRSSCLGASYSRALTDLC